MAAIPTKMISAVITSYDYQPGCSILSDSNLALEVSSILQSCFPTFRKDMSIEETLREGIGFHDLKDTTWILLRETTTDQLIGLATAIDYHNGIYVCNLCVSPGFQRRGLGLDLLEAAGMLTIPSGTEQAREGMSRLIGHADAQNSSLLQYYTRLGATEVPTGITRSSSATGSRLRFERKIPNTRDGMILFFQSIRNRRMKERQNRLWLVGCSLLGVVSGIAMLLVTRHHFIRRK